MALKQCALYCRAIGACDWNHNQLTCETYRWQRTSQLHLLLLFSTYLSTALSGMLLTHCFSIASFCFIFNYVGYCLRNQTTLFTIFYAYKYVRPVPTVLVHVHCNLHTDSPCCCNLTKWQLVKSLAITRTTGCSLDSLQDTRIALNHPLFTFFIHHLPLLYSAFMRFC